MSVALPRRIAVFTPLPPTRSGIAAYNAGFLPELARRLDVTAYVDDDDLSTVLPVPRVAIRAASNYDPRVHDLAVFHMGNQGPYHRFVHEALCRHPGLVVLHDLRLTDFFRWLEHHEPGSATLTLPRTARSSDAPGAVDIASLGQIMDQSKAVLVHSAAMAARVRSAFPAARVFTSHLAEAPRIPPFPPPSAADLGWPESSLVVGSIGGIGRHKGIHRLVPLVGGLRRGGLDVRLVISGWVFDPAYLAEIERSITAEGLDDAVRVATDLSDREISALYSACDATIDLRENLTGASSMSLLTSLSHRRPTIVPDLEEFRDIDDPLLLRVSVDPGRMISDCGSMIARMALAKVRGDAPPADDDRNRCAERLASAVSGYVQAIETCIALESPPESTISKQEAATAVRDVPRVTVVGNLLAATGLMQYGRRIVETLHGAGAKLDYFHLPTSGVPENAALDAGRLHERLPWRREAHVELWLLNINEFNVVDPQLIRPPGTRRHLIGSWFWELPTVHSPFVEHFRFVDELWVGSPFIARTFRQYTDVPITVVPMPIATLPDDSIDRGHFGIPDDAVVYFFDFDAHSHASRKNPFGLIAAFRRAFSPNDRDHAGRRPVLVIKTRRLDHPYHVRLDGELRRSMDDLGGILIDSDLDVPVFDSLVALSDVYVSMHRAEGLGLGMLEAMHHGKPVISPAYPDKWIFPASALGLNVPSPLRRITEEDQEIFPEARIVYSPGASWSEPSIERTAELMRRLFDEPELRARAGERAARLVRENYGVPASLRVMSKRLRRIQVPSGHSTKH